MSELTRNSFSPRTFCFRLLLLTKSAVATLPDVVAAVATLPDAASFRRLAATGNAMSAVSLKSERIVTIRAYEKV